MKAAQNLPTIKEAIAYLDGIGYDLTRRGRGTYIFQDRTGNRPLHNQTMYWTLRELRDAVRFGC